MAGESFFSVDLPSNRSLSPGFSNFSPDNDSLGNASGHEIGSMATRPSTKVTAKADPAGLGFRFEERAAAEGVADQYAGMGIAAAGNDLFVTNSRREPSAAYVRVAASRPPAFRSVRSAFFPALGTAFAGWGDSWVDLANSGTPDLVLAAGAIPVTSLAKDAEPVRVLAALAGTRPARFGSAVTVFGGRGPWLNGRGLAAADVGNDGRMDVAINSIGGRLVLLQSTGPIGHWLDVSLDAFSPGAVVTAVLPSGPPGEACVLSCSVVWPTVTVSFTPVSLVRLPSSL